jgi:hypothetical protein
VTVTVAIENDGRLLLSHAQLQDDRLNGFEMTAACWAGNAEEESARAL